MGKLYNEYKNSYSLTEHKNGELFLNCVDDLYKSVNVQDLANFTQHHNVDRLQHVSSVAYTSYLICRHLHLDYREAARGALLHDLYYYDWRHKDHNAHRMHGFRHPGFALQNAKILCDDLTHKEEVIIKRHMWPLTVVPPTNMEAFVVCMMDKYCAVIELMGHKYMPPEEDK